MNPLVLADEVYTFRARYESFTKRYMNPPKDLGIKKGARFLYDHFVVISDGNPMGRTMAACLDALVQRGTIGSAKCIALNEAETFEGYEYGGCAFLSLEELLKEAPLPRTAYLFYADTANYAEGERMISAMEQICTYAAGAKQSFCTLSIMLPEYPVIPQGIESLAEREFSYFMEKAIEEPTPAQRFLIDLEKAARKIVGGGYETLNIARVDNLFGLDANHIRTFDLEQFIKESFEKGEVTILPEDYENILTISYLQNALAFSTQLLYTARKGQIYHFMSHTASIAQIKQALHEGFADELSLKAEAPAVKAPKYRCLNTLKFYLCGWTGATVLPLADDLYQVACNLTGHLHKNANNIKIYAGKLHRIKELEMMMLRDIDEICKKHDIQYFLCGGTMLGAVRYGHSIPWDDDLDIGMLREDFDKFRKVCQEEHPEIYNYSSHVNKSGSHYIVDKLRLNGTYFTTKFSSVHEYPDGLFIDVLVYDRTTNNKFLGNLQCKLLHKLARVIEIRWYNRPRKSYYYKSSKRLLPLLRLFPVGFYNKLFEFIIKFFTKTKNARYVIDSTGKLQIKGPFPIDGLEEVQRVPYDEGFMAPIPKDYTNYLTFDYGPNYLPEPVLSQRKAPHNFARIDLGEYIFDTHKSATFRELNVHGELFEKE